MLIAPSGMIRVLALALVGLVTASVNSPDLIVIRALYRSQTPDIDHLLTAIKRASPRADVDRNFVQQLLEHYLAPLSVPLSFHEAATSVPFEATDAERLGAWQQRGGRLDAKSTRLMYYWARYCVFKQTLFPQVVWCEQAPDGQRMVLTQRGMHLYLFDVEMKADDAARTRKRSRVDAALTDAQADEQLSEWLEAATDEETGQVLQQRRREASQALAESARRSLPVGVPVSSHHPVTAAVVPLSADHPMTARMSLPATAPVSIDRPAAVAAVPVTESSLRGQASDSQAAPCSEGVIRPFLIRELIRDLHASMDVLSERVSLATGTEISALAIGKVRSRMMRLMLQPLWLHQLLMAEPRADDPKVFVKIGRTAPRGFDINDIEMRVRIWNEYCIVPLKAGVEPAPCRPGLVELGGRQHELFVLRSEAIIRYLRSLV